MLRWLICSLYIVAVIHVDPKNLKMTPKPFTVRSAEGLEGSHGQSEVRGEYFKGYFISMAVDPRDVLGPDPPGTGSSVGFRFAARVTSPTTITVTAPIMDYHDRGFDLEAVRDSLVEPITADDIVMIEALRHSANEFNKTMSEHKNTMHYVLDFGPNVKLSSKVLEIHSGKADGLMSEEAICTFVELPCLGPTDELGWAYDEDGNPIQLPNGSYAQAEVVRKYWCGRLCWRVADLQLGSRKQRLETGEVPTDAAAAMMRGLRMGGLRP